MGGTTNMLKNLLAVLAASAIALGVSAGTAEATVPAHHDNCVGTANVLSCNGSGNVLNGVLPNGLLGNSGGPLGLGVVPGLRRHWPRPGFFPGGAYGWSPYLRGEYLDLAEFGGPGFSQVAVCPFSSFGGFSGTYRHRFGSRWPRVESLFARRGFGDFEGGFGAMRAQACGTQVIPVPVAVPEQVYDPGLSSCGCASPAAYFPPSNDGRINSVPQSAPSAGDSGLAPDAVRVR